MKAKIIVTLYIKNVAGALYTVNYNENTLSVSVSVSTFDINIQTICDYNRIKLNFKKITFVDVWNSLQATTF